MKTALSMILMNYKISKLYHVRDIMKIKKGCPARTPPGKTAFFLSLKSPYRFMLYTFCLFATNTGKVSLPFSSFPSVIVTFLSEITYSTFAPASTTVSCISTQFFTFAPLATLTPRNRMLFSTSPRLHSHLLP